MKIIIPRRFPMIDRRCAEDRDSIIDWCEENGIVLVTLDPARNPENEIFWELYLNSEKDAVAVKLRWSE